MGKIYVGQSDLTIELTTGKDITGATSIKIGYKSPSGAIGEFDAVSKDNATGVIEAVFTAQVNLNQSGTWRVWAKIINAGGLLSIGESSEFTVYQEGN